ncbi:DNA-primase RepB domain-containing protein [Siccirubricoccus sp. G192]|uniref:DNA-primase RepB domain-containing protein n=1 Tax=Siccirubricoccus sp. G192 TaxID=2849651 RepID=UPI001C2C59E3|nr:DNA-primase RepB domain-containing protein [Siccirubricoccus sp. G192]MBV1798723.1 RepB family DNA primase [Siccirubricoccus sp. G192]
MSAAHSATLARDRTRLAVDRWLAALPAASFDLRLVPADEPGPTLCRRFDAAGFLAALGWIRARNAAGCHVYCRPLANRHVLVDDLCPDAVAELTATHTAAAIVETSKANYQAWITLSAEEIPAPLAAAAARLLARRFGGDLGAASAQQLGRLAGTTNQKEKYRRGDGTAPLCAAPPGWPGRRSCRPCAAGRGSPPRPGSRSGTAQRPRGK